jgi:hypothetical protein
MFLEEINYFTLSTGPGEHFAEWASNKWIRRINFQTGGQIILAGVELDAEVSAMTAKGTVSAIVLVDNRLCQQTHLAESETESVDLEKTSFQVQIYNLCSASSFYGVDHSSSYLQLC